MRQTWPSETTVGRREFLLYGLLPIPLLHMCASLASADCDGKGDDVAVFIPGFMGSTLSENGVPIWSDKAWETYDTLINNHEKLRHQKGNAFDDTDVLKAMELWKIGFANSEIDFYGPLLDFLESRGFKTVLPFSYDWRQDMFAILDRLRGQLQRTFGIRYQDGQAEESGLKVHLVGHSMGGVLSLLAAGRQLIHPNDLCRLILIAPPTAGSPDAFRSTFDASQLPGLEAMFNVWWRKNRRLAWENLHSVIRSFPSIYQLMPPYFQDYINTGSWTNPFSEGVFDAGRVAAGQKLHAAIADAIQTFPIEKGRVDLILGTTVDTDGHYFVRATTTNANENTYEFRPPDEVQLPEGDGTVLNNSSVYRTGGVDHFGDLVTVRRYIGVGHSELCTDRNVMELLATLLPR